MTGGKTLKQVVVKALDLVESFHVLKHIHWPHVIVKYKMLEKLNKS